MIAERVSLKHCLIAFIKVPCYSGVSSHRFCYMFKNHTFLHYWVLQVECMHMQEKRVGGTSQTWLVNLFSWLKVMSRNNHHLLGGLDDWISYYRGGTGV